MFTREFNEFHRTHRETLRKNPWGRYLHLVSFSMIESLVAPGSKFLAIGPRVAKSMAALRSFQGVVIDPYFEDSDAVAMPQIRFFQEFEQFKGQDEKFDCIILSYSIGMMEDILCSLKDLRRFCHSSTRVITVYYSRAWQPMIKLAESLGLKSKSPVLNWVPIEEIENLMFLADFQTIKRSMFCLAPVYVPFVTNFINKFISNLPIINLAGVITLEVSRPLHLSADKRNDKPSKVSIVVPARNEAGNIAEIVMRLPHFPGGEEIIFVEGGSTDNTREAIEQVIRDNPKRDISFFTQDGKGKKNAVERGFGNAQGDILVILDADITVPPESVPRFVEVLTSGKGEFVNGSRMVYPMRGKAMRFLNLLANIFFSWAFSYLLDQQVRDTLCGTKVLRRKDYERIVANRSYFGDFDPFGDFDLLFGATHVNLKIVDLPVRYEERRYGDTNIRRWRDGFYLLRMVVFGMRKLKFHWMSMRSRPA